MGQLALKMPFYILSLDGGGSLGVYTVGVLIEIERMLGKRLHEVFDLVYGTSTGSIIGSMIALGEEIDTIRKRYLEIAPDVMGRWFPRRKSMALRRHAEEIFGRKKFDDFLIDTGIVATHLEYNRPMVFKRNVGRAHGSQASFRPGFGCTIADAVTASCAAHPVFRAKSITTPDHGVRTVVDGGFSANNPALFALADALGPLKIPRSDVRVLSIGTGEFPERPRLLSSMLSAFTSTRNIMTLLGTSSNTVTVLQRLLFRDVHALRINETFSQKEYRTDFIESDRDKLEQILQLGKLSFWKNEEEIGSFFQEPPRYKR